MLLILMKVLKFNERFNNKKFGNCFYINNIVNINLVLIVSEIIIEILFKLATRKYKYN